MTDSSVAVHDDVRAPNGMVCSVDHLARGRRRDPAAGGTAADAAVATSAVLAVTTQHMCGMGGDLFAIVHHRDGSAEVLNASGAPGAAPIRTGCAPRA